MQVLARKYGNTLAFTQTTRPLFRALDFTLRFSIVAIVVVVVIITAVVVFPLIK